MKESNAKTIMLFLFIAGALYMAAPGSLRAAEVSFPEESKACLECHGQRGITITFKNTGETLEAYVDERKFRSSVHASLSCSACHNEFSRENHPERSFRSRDQYSLKSSLACRQCHSDVQIKKSSIHATLLEKSDTSPVCTSCHSAHTVTALSGDRKFATEKQYCMSCHQHNLKMTHRNGESLSLKVDNSILDRSAHFRLSCVDCHFGYSSDLHPRRNFKDGRTFSITQSEACRRCHFDKYTKTIESIHFTVLSQGNMQAPVCTDCHGAHGVSLARMDQTASAHRCGNCHGDIYNKYASSVHGNALLNEHNTDVPVCVDCHTAHSIEDARTTDYRDKVPDICGKCHANKDVMKKYGLNTGVVNSYLQDFHGITLKFYRQQKTSSAPAKRKSIATCTDCHGVHDIVKATGAGAQTVKTRLAKRCQKCHAGAPENFPDSWLSHYEASFTHAPLVFGINLLYRFFIPFMMIGLILQILLHIWRYVMNR